ncbi:Uncharacterised protein [Veillonella dispar]|uniref:Uncharacterized protein n=1 Tax=Veillonella dispar TaxID=39778 RepID=A0A6N2ZPE1_9FIRM
MSCICGYLHFTRDLQYEFFICRNIFYNSSFIQIFQVLVIYLGLIFADYSNKIFAIVLFLVSISEMLKLVYLKKIVNKEINKETNMPYKLTDVISRLNIYSRIIFIIVLNTFVNFLVFK